MKRATSKILNFVFLGLLTFAATLFYSSNVFADAPKPVPSAFGADDEGRVAGVAYDNAWEFMYKWLTPGNDGGYRTFEKDFGSEETDKFRVECGSTICNLRSTACMRKAQSLSSSEIQTKLQEQKNAAYEKQMFICRDEDPKYPELAIKQSPQAADDYCRRIIAKKDYFDEDKARDLIVNEYGCISKLNISTKQREGWVIVHAQNVGEGIGEKCYEARTAGGGVGKYCMEVTDGTAVVIAKSRGGTKTCQVIPVRWYNNKECPMCGLVGIVYAAADKITALSYNKLGYSFSIVLILGFAIWLAIKTLIFASSMTKQDAAKYITEVLKQGYKFALAYFSIIYFHDVFSFIILPLINAGINFGNSFVSVTTLAERFDENIAQYINQNNIPALISLGDGVPADYRRHFNNQYFDIRTYGLLENFTYNINLNYALLQSVGGTLFCLGGKFVTFQLTDLWQTPGKEILTHIPLGLNCYTYGACFAIFGFLLSVSFIFYMLDAVVQFGIVGALLPFLIASWPFKITSKYTSTGFKMLINSVFTFMMMGLIVKLGIELISASLSISSNTEETSPGLYSLVKAIDTIHVPVIQQKVNVLSMSFFLFMFANMMAFLSLGKTGALVSRFAGGGIKPIAPAIGGMAASAATSVAKKVAAPTMNAVGEWAEDKMTKGVKTAKNLAINTIKNPVGVAKEAAKTAWAVGTIRPVRKTADKLLSKTKWGREFVQDKEDVKDEIKNELKNSKIAQEINRLDGQNVAELAWNIASVKPLRKVTTNAILKTEAGQKVQQKLNDVGDKAKQKLNNASDKIKNSWLGRGAKGAINLFKDAPVEDNGKSKEENLQKSQDILGARKEEVATIGNEDANNNTATIGNENKNPEGAPEETAIIGDENKQNDVTPKETPKEGEKPTKENLNELE